MNSLPPSVKDISQANLSITISEPQFSDPDQKSFRTKKQCEFKFWGEKKDNFVDFDADSTSKNTKEVNVKYDIKTTRENFYKYLYDCATLKLQFSHELHKKKTKTREKIGKATVNLRGYLNKNVGSDQNSNQVILIDREFDIISKKKEGNGIVEGKVGRVRLQIKDNYSKNLLENQLTQLEHSEDEKISSFALNEIKTKMDLNAKFSSHIYKEYDDNRTVASSMCPETKRFESNDQATYFEPPKAQQFFRPNDLDSSIGTKATNINLGNIKDRAKESKITTLIDKISKMKHEINASQDNLEDELVFYNEHNHANVKQSYTGNGSPDFGSNERLEDVPFRNQDNSDQKGNINNIRVEQDGRQLKTYTQPGSSIENESDELQEKYKVSEFDKRYHMQNQKYYPCYLRQLSFETANIEFIKYDSLKKFLRERTQFHFVFSDPMTSELLHQITLQKGEFLKTELICYKDINLDLNDLKNDNMNAKPFLTVTMFYNLAKDVTIPAASNKFFVKDMIKKENEQQGVSIALYLNMDMVDKFKEKNFSLEKLKAEQNNFKNDKTLSAKSNIEVITFSCRLLNIFHKPQVEPDNNQEDPNEPAQNYKSDLLNLYLQVDEAKSVSARDKFTPYRRLFVKIKDPIENNTVSTNEIEVASDASFNFHVSFPFSYSKNISDLRKCLILEVWDKENYTKTNFVGIIKLDLERGLKYLQNNSLDDIKSSIYPLIMYDSFIGIFNFKENTDDGFLKVTLSIGTVDQNLRLQQSINEKMNEKIRSHQESKETTRQAEMVQQKGVSEIAVDTGLVQDNKQNSELKGTKHSAQTGLVEPEDLLPKEKEAPEFSKQIKQLKILHFLQNQISKLDISIQELFKGQDQRDGLISKDHFVKAFSDRNFLNSTVTLDEVVIASELFDQTSSVDLDEFIRCQKSYRDGSEQAKRMNFNFIKELCKQINSRQEWEQIKQLQNSMSLLDQFWEKNDVQTLQGLFVDCGVQLKIEFKEWSNVFVSAEDVFRLLLNRITEQTFFLEFVLNEKNLRLQFNFLLIKIVKKLKEQGKTQQMFLRELDKIDSAGYAHIDNLVEKVHALDIIVTSFELIVLKAYLGQDEITKKIWLTELYRALEDMVNQINEKHPGQLRTDERPVPISIKPTEEPKLQVDDDLIIGVLNDKKNKSHAPLSNVDKWENDLLYSINQRTKPLALVPILQCHNKHIVNDRDINRLNEQSLLQLFHISRLNVTANENHSLFHHLISKQCDLPLDFVSELIREKKEPVSENYSIEDITCEHIPFSLTNVISVDVKHIQPQFRNFDSAGLNAVLNQPLFLKQACEQTGTECAQTDLFAFSDKQEKTFMSELITNADSSINLLKQDLDSSTEHIIKRNYIESIVKEDSMLEIYLCTQDEFKDNHIGKAEILQSDFVESEVSTGSFSINRNVVFQGLKTNSPLFKVNCSFKATTLVNQLQQVDTTYKFINVTKLYPEINKFNLQIYNLHNVNSNLVGERVKIEVIKHQLNESIPLDTLETTVTHKPPTDSTKGYPDSSQQVLTNIFNTQTIIDKKYSFNATKDELTQATIELRFYNRNQFLGNIELKLSTAINKFRGAYGTFATQNKGSPSPFLTDLMLHPVDILDHYKYNGQFTQIDFLRMHQMLEFDNLSMKFVEYNNLKMKSEGQQSKERNFNEKSSNLTNQNQELAKKISQLERELNSYKNKEQDLIRQKNQEIEREKEKIRKELEQSKLEQSRMNTSPIRLSSMNQMQLKVTISSVHDLKTSESPNTSVQQTIQGRDQKTNSKPGKLPYFDQHATHPVDLSFFSELSQMKFTLKDSNSDRNFEINVDLILLKELKRSEGWYFIQDIGGEHQGQIFIGLETEGDTDELQRGGSEVELLKDSVFLNQDRFDQSTISNDDQLYKKHKLNLNELDRVTQKMKNYLLNDEFDEDKDVQDDIPHDTGYITRDDLVINTESNTNMKEGMSNFSTLDREKGNTSPMNNHIAYYSNYQDNQPNANLFNESAKLQHELTDAVRQVNSKPQPKYQNSSLENELLGSKEKEMIQNVSLDIDNFINNAKIIQDSINEAMAYKEGLTDNLKEEFYRSNLKNSHQLEDIQDVSYESNDRMDQQNNYQQGKGYGTKKYEVREQKSPQKHNNQTKTFDSPKVPHEDVNLNQIRSIGRNQNKDQDEPYDKENHTEVAQSSSDDQTFLNRKKPKLKQSSILKSPAFKKELESLNKHKQSEIEKISSILKNY